MSAHNQNPKERAATLTLTLGADSGYEADAEYRISAEQWGEILRICEDKDEKFSIKTPAVTIQGANQRIDLDDIEREACDTPWKDAVIEQLIIAHILGAEHAADPHKAVQDLLAYHADIAADPRVSEAAAKLVEDEREACAKVCETQTETGAHKRCAAAIRARNQPTKNED